jgi:hypothetical protein
MGRKQLNTQSFVIEYNPSDLNNMKAKNLLQYICAYLLTDKPTDDIYHIHKALVSGANDIVFW